MPSRTYELPTIYAQALHQVEHRMDRVRNRIKPLEQELVKLGQEQVRLQKLLKEVSPTEPEPTED